MSMFFEEEKKSVPNKEDQYGVIAATFLILFAGILTLLGWIFKPLLTWLFDFRDTSKEVAIVKVVVIFIILGSCILGLWQIQLLRDLTLSNSHTLNRNETGTRILFPDRLYFVVEGNNRLIEFGSKKYITYSGYTKNTAQKVNRGTCHLLPRNESAMFASENLPVEAEGFTDVVEYTVVQSFPNLPWWRHIQETVTHPSYFFKSTDERLSITVSYTKEATWSEFGRDWDSLYSFPSGHKPFEIKAKFYENAVICF